MNEMNACENGKSGYSVADRYYPAENPTMYFIGVTTAKSSIRKVFPAWIEYLNLGPCELKGIDFKLHEEPQKYREAVEFIKNDPLSLGALVTTHKIDLLKACYDKFDFLDEYATLMVEISCISKKDGKLFGHAKDPISSGFSLDAFIPKNHWEKTGAEVLILGAGGSAIAVSWYLMRKDHGNNRPSKIYIVNRSTHRLKEMKHIHDQINTSVDVEYIHSPNHDIADKIMNRLMPGSMVINATGLGKDAPGSPVSDKATFPRDGFVWDFNYRGDLIFLDQARKQKKEQNLYIEDGWVYFIHGWTRVIAEVFHVDIPTNGLVFDKLSELAALQRR
jgi:shikimate 5-dehydrogenase